MTSIMQGPSAGFERVIHVEGEEGAGVMTS